VARSVGEELSLSTRKLRLEEALKALAGSRTAEAKSPIPSAVRLVTRTDGNLEGSAPPGEALRWGIAALIALALIDWFAVKLL
jgi:hypothetical protein